MTSRYLQPRMAGRRPDARARGGRATAVLLRVLIGAALCSGAAIAGADESVQGARTASRAAELIRAMSTALRTLDYEGTFVHLAGDNLTSLAIAHTTDGSGERERLSALDGEAREVFRNESLVTCIWPESRSVVVTDAKPRNSLPTIDASLVDNKHYELAMRDADRVAGLATHVVEVLPRDSLRYGYRFWIDQRTHMLLRSMLLDERRQPLEQVLFTAIRYPDSIDPDTFEPASKVEHWDWARAQLASGARASASADSNATPGDGIVDPLDRITFEGLPDGYREVGSSLVPMPGSTRPVGHFMLSDGMASVSVYVEQLPLAEQHGGTLGLSRMGAMNAFGHSLADAFVTVVGEVPAETVVRIARATRVQPR